MTIEILPFRNLGEVGPGTDICGAILSAETPAPRDGDILVVTQKIISKMEDRYVDLGSVEPTEEARLIASLTLKDPRLVTLVLQESSEVLRAVPNVLIVRHKLGFVMANAGIDQSNLGSAEGEWALLLPADPDGAAERLRAELARRAKADLAVIISDSFGRPWREGIVNVAIGSAGMASLVDMRGTLDRDGRPLAVTQIALADGVAAAAGLVFGEADESVPAALVRGVPLYRAQTNAARAIIRPLDQDLFR